MNAAGAACAAMLLACALHGPAAFAQSEPDATWRTFLDGPGLIGNPRGVRTRLSDAGIHVSGGYLVEGARNVNGGERRGGGYADQLNVSVAVDLERAFGWTGTTLHVGVASRGGQNVSATHVGNLFEVQETYGGGRTARVADVSLDRAFASGRVNVLAGRIFAGADFAFSPVHCAFQTNAICGHPNSLPYNSGISLYPVASWGVRVNVETTSSSYARTGVYEVNPSLNGAHGLDWSTRRATGVFVPAEFGVRTEGGGDRPGLYRAGAYYDSSSTPDSYFDVDGGSRALSGLPARTRTHRLGGYLLFEQRVSAPGGGRGLTLFGGVTASDRATAYFQSFAQLGAVYTGVLAARPRDTLAAAVARGRVSTRIADFERDVRTLQSGTPVQTSETVFELNYGLQLGGWLVLRPGIQYVRRPGAIRERPDATVLALQMIVGF